MSEPTKNLQKADVIARIFGKTVRRIQQLTQDGVLPTVETPQGRRYDLLPTITRYIQYLEQRADKNGSKNVEKEDKKLDAEIQYKQAKADKMKLELDELKGSMHRSEDVERLLNERVFLMRSLLLALPGRVAMELATLNTAPEVSAYLSRQVAVILDNMATMDYNPSEFAELVRERQGWKSEDKDDDDDEAED